MTSMCFGAWLDMQLAAEVEASALAVKLLPLYIPSRCSYGWLNIKAACPADNYNLFLTAQLGNECWTLLQCCRTNETTGDWAELI